VRCHPTGSFHRLYQRLQRIQCWPAATVDAVVRVRRIDVDQHQPVIGALSNKSVLTLLLTMIDGKKTSVFVAFGRGAETNASALVALSDVFAGGVVERRLLSGWSFQQRLEPCQ
jgi:hypothetical protein